ncbi:MAG: hypothetical protein AB1921_20450 [Thermodesulfobacteriota bacterium]
MNEKGFEAKGLATFIGSLPFTDHERALDLTVGAPGEVPPWAQLARLPGEGMIEQFAHGLPGLVKDGRDLLVDTACEGFTEELTAFYEDALAVEAEGQVEDGSRFALTPEIAPGFFAFEKRIAGLSVPPPAVKGQATGPFTLAVSLKDREGRAAFYDERLLDCITRMIAAKARWQARRLSRLCSKVIVFLDEPGLTGFGSSAYLGISREQAAGCLAPSVAAIQEAGGLAGVHVCGNTDWSLLLTLPIDIVNFDAYSFLPAFLAYGKELAAFLNRGGVIAWGAVPTSRASDIAAETEETLFARFTEALAKLASLGFSTEEAVRRSLITPACGLGSLSQEQALRVVGLTRGLAARVRGLVS